MSDDDLPDGTPDGTDGTPDEEPSRPPLPVARPGASPATQVATVAGVVVVLLVLAVVFVLQGREDGTRARQPGSPGAPSALTSPPAVPPSGEAPATASSLAADPLTVPASLCPSLTEDHPFTVLTFNIHSAIRKGGGLEAGTLIREITSWKPDLVLLQEADNNRSRSGNVVQAQQIGEALGMSWVAGSGQTGNALLSRFPITAQRIVALPRAGGKFDRHAVHAVVDIEGTEVSVYATHFDHVSEGARVAQARYLARVMAADPRPTIVGGDLNSGPGSTPVTTLRAAGLGDVWAVGSGSGFTAPAARPRVRIDFLLHDGFFQPVQSVVLASRVSDHRAVWARLRISEKIGCIKVGG